MVKSDPENFSEKRGKVWDRIEEVCSKRFGLVEITEISTDEV